jgi:hypothetical protein
VELGPLIVEPLMSMCIEGCRLETGLNKSEDPNFKSEHQENLNF